VGGVETAKLFKHGGSQAVRLPKDFRLPGTEVRVRRLGRGVLLEPMEPNVGDITAIFAEIDRLGGNEFLPDGRPGQPLMPPAYDVSLDQWSASTRMPSSPQSTNASPTFGGV
jgi:antitoxin VapB